MQVVVEMVVELCFFLIFVGIFGIYSYVGIGNVVVIVCDLVKKWDFLFVLYFDYYEDLVDIMCKVQVGICLVMIDGFYLLFEENVVLVKSVVELSYCYDVSVEVELGCLGGVEDDLVVDVKDVFYINFEQVCEFVVCIGIDLLVVVIGIVYGFYIVELKFDFECLVVICDCVDVLLVLYGVFGLLDSDICCVIFLGVCKVNVVIELKIVFLDVLKVYFLENLGVNDFCYYMKLVKVVMKEVVCKVIYVCGCEG